MVARRAAGVAHVLLAAAACGATLPSLSPESIVRLRQIKLAGFKSFVDPTQIDVPGSLVGVVGPNGCGKSNVIDAVRWVLGESKAAELRGESMQDVIFNGSGNRKPAGRASVELAFDNTDGRIQGEWGKYAEITVKRVLSRDGASSYYINNQTVRRRDVQDMFLGTGLGPRAYAIIGQGMISRIIEARPEELRIFLEEAAGVSKYKERRRETENRLSDTRDNLTRVEDILRELDAQIDKLAQQAEVAQRYHHLKADHDRQQQLLWLVRKQEALAEQERIARDMQARSTALEAHVADLRATELALEQARAAHYAAGDAVHAAQGEVMQVTADISKVESEIRLVADSRARLAGELARLADTRTRRLAEIGALQGRTDELQRSLGEGELRLGAVGENLLAQEQTLPALEQAYAAARDALTAAKSEAALAERSIEAAGSEQRSFDRQLAALMQRRERLEEERASLGAPDEARLATLTADGQRQGAELERLTAQVQAHEQQGHALQGERQQAADARGREADALTRLEARLAALREMQSKVEADERLDPWLKAQGLDTLPRLFRKLQVDAGWETAFEAVLRERIEAIEVGRIDTLAGLAGNGPPARVAFFSPTSALPAAEAAPVGLGRLADKVRGHDAALAAVLGDWLTRVYAADTLAQAMAMREQLPAGGQLVTREGHVVTRSSVRFHAPDDRKAGLLARRQEIDNTDKEVRGQKLLVEQAVGSLARCEAQLRGVQEQLQHDRTAAERLRGQVHAIQLESVRLSELIERVRHRTGQIDVELADVRSQGHDLERSRDDADSRFQELDQQLAARHEAVETARLAYEAADARLREARAQVQSIMADRSRIEAELAANRSRAADVTHAIGVAQGEIARLAIDMGAADAELGRLDDSAVRSGLDPLLAERTRREEALREARSRQDQVATELRTLDEKRLKLDQEQQPRRDKITELQLKEQAARLAVEQFAQQLAEAQADEAQLAASLAQQPQRASALQAEITRLAQALVDLGAVNLAALDELTTSRERKSFLDAQSADLKSAIDTLEDAIRKIDRETRELLQQTFDQVNLQFGQLFPRLFGGGEARLNMTGDEILDAGVQVMAQPPGKRNSTIHLLSGGEKALTATALVFALFKLNPAPFCLLDEVDAPLDDANTDRFCNLVRSMTQTAERGGTQFLFITHNKIAMEMAEQLIGVTMQEQGVSRIVAVDIDSAVRLTAEAA